MKKICAQCKKEFEALRRGTKYCSQDGKPNIVAATEAKLDEMKREAYKEQPKKQ